MLIRKSKL